ncbi:hypothetical protein Sango_2852600 [Sesamum angolense]|uniref:DUF547 domain-containing protein n=1 Tax=Sesamum angolense TaxID=2727404 RepID=A0AAE1T7Q7_9LAMI|nr:hypothetical protein Sango_2852600 [Sesamum angolense]
MSMAPVGCSSPSSPLDSTSAVCSQVAKDHESLIDCYKSSAELMNEIATLEVEIVRLERYLLSLYRTAFQQHLPSNPGNHVQQIKGLSPWNKPDQPSPRRNLETSKDYHDHQGQISPTSALTGPNDLIQVAIPKSSSGRENRITYSRHRSLADHLGNCRIDDALLRPDKLSEDIIRCISSIYCKLANPGRTNKGYSVSSASSFCSSSTFSPRNLSGSWSPQCNDEVIQDCDFEGLKPDNGPYSEMVEVLKICLDDESYSYAATMLQKFRSLVKSLEIVDLKKMRREEKLAFWINIHNALVMHAYLAYGTQNYIKSTFIVKAAYNVGGHCVNAYDIQSYILGIKSHYSPPAYSDPAVRVYTAKNIFQDLKVAKEEFIQATVYVHKQTKIYLPKILRYYAKDMSLGMAALLEVVSGCLTGIQQTAIRKFMNGRPEKYVYWLEQSSSFRYLIHKDIAERRWGG